MQIPTFDDILAAQKRISSYLKPTPLISYPTINDLVGTEVHIKHENSQPVGAFKVRGGVNLISRLSDKEKERGVIGASTGNHGQSIAYASRIFDVKATIVMPEKANPGKVAAMKALGAEIVFHGATFDEARIHCEHLAKELGFRYIHSGDEPDMIAGVATETLEMLQEEPGIETIIVPVGGGSGAAGTCIAAKSMNPEIEVIAVQDAAAPAAHDSWRQGKLVERPNRTSVEGLSTGTAFELPQKILRNHLDEFILVSEQEIMRATIWMIQHAHTLAEGAGAAPLAAAYKIRERLADKTVGLICSGGNLSLDKLRKALDFAISNPNL
ncbi:MAG: threonine ammonia-lyase [Candidatus Thorarchaeota archaeon]|jgi:threonine dehydratase